MYIVLVVRLPILNFRSRQQSPFIPLVHSNITSNYRIGIVLPYSVNSMPSKYMLTNIGLLNYLFTHKLYTLNTINIVIIASYSIFTIVRMHATIAEIWCVLFYLHTYGGSDIVLAEMKIYIVYMPNRTKLHTMYRPYLVYCKCKRSYCTWSE